MNKEQILAMSEEEIISRCCMALDLRITGVGVGFISPVASRSMNHG